MQATIREAREIRNTQAEKQMCMIVGWRRIKGAWKDIHEVAALGTILVREPTGFRVMYSEAVTQGLLS